ncbi:MAG: methyltransferase domain-containing protein [Candidatus Margulisiibacteriota bacterium]
MDAYESLIFQLRDDDIIKSTVIFEAFLTMHRCHFVANADESSIALDCPIPIGFGQTNSQPRTVAMMLEWLSPQPNDQILDIGCGSGWTSALLGHIVGERGHIIGLDRIPELVALASRNVSKFNLPQVHIDLAGQAIGQPHQTFDRILVSAAAETFPQALLSQLKPNGILVIPVKNTIFRIQKDDQHHITEDRFEGFRFVPLIGF